VGLNSSHSLWLSKPLCLSDFISGWQSISSAQHRNALELTKEINLTDTVRTCSQKCDHTYRKMYMFTFLPLWLGMMTFCAAAVCGMGWNGTITAILIMCSVFIGGEVYEPIRDRMERAIRLPSGDLYWFPRFFLYMALVPLFPMATIYALHAIGMPGLEYAWLKGAWVTGGSLAIMFALFRLSNMPVSISRLIEPLRHKR
jgi:hypothetical protein